MGFKRDYWGLLAVWGLPGFGSFLAWGFELRAP